MSKNYSKKRRLKYIAVAVALSASFTAMSFAAACTNNEEEETPPPAKTKEDLQLLKNGNFEFFNVPEKEKDGNEPVYLINTPNSWTHGGTSSSAMSGIVDTNKTAWEAITAETLAETLDANNALKPSDKNYKEQYVDYNGMKSGDIPYADTYAALNYKEEEAEEGDTDPRKEFLANPGTHYNIEGNDTSGYFYKNEKGEDVKVYKNDEGDFFLDKDFKETFTNVLMLHNYSSSAHNGISQNYSSVSIDMPANTAAEVSVWVKTSNLLFQQGTEVVQDRGAYISVSHTVGGTTLDDFTISCINTEKLNPEGEGCRNNGWVEYTVYVKACDFASSTISLKLGLGESNYLVEGYAFFDDVKVTKHVDLDSTSYNENRDEIENAGKYRAEWRLTDDASDKVFKADVYERNGGQAEGGITENRFSKNFHYLLDLASGKDYRQFDFTAEGFKTGLTVDGDNYVSSKYTNMKTLNVTATDPNASYKIPTELKNVKVNGETGKGLDVSNDILALINAGGKFESSFTSYHEILNEALENAAELPTGENSTVGEVLVMLSAKGAAYTSSFDIKLEAGERKIVSFWVKTSDMNGSTAATVNITEEGNKSNTASFTLDTTNSSTDIDDEHKDIYNGWVQCFFFLHNQDEETAATVNAEIKFGNTSLKETAVSSYKGGWLAMTNAHTLDNVDEETFAYTSTGDHAVALTITEDSEKKITVFDEAYGSQANAIEKGIVNPSTYSGVNGASSSVVNNGAISIPYDDINSNPDAGLINKKYFKNYVGTDWYEQLLTSFGIQDKSENGAEAAWDRIFGEKSLQPLIILNNERTDKYQIDVAADEKSYKDGKHYVKTDEGKFELVAADAEFDKKENYYLKSDVMNYGFIGKNQSVSSNSYGTVSVRVKVSAGAAAYIYLTDTADGKNVLSYSAPSYSYWYDADGNVLMKEPDDDMSLTDKRNNILYKLRTDGLYEDKDGKLFANVHNYNKLYKDQTKNYYSDKEGKNPVAFDKLDGTVTYYYENGSVANHFLVSKDGEKVYEYESGKYYYMVEGKRGTEVNPFTTDSSYLRYDNTKASPEYSAVIDTTVNPELANKWITISFVLHAGSEGKNYRLELWSGEREKTHTEHNTSGAVIFDHSYTSVSDDKLRDAYESEIINSYKKLLSDNGQLSALPTSSENIAFFEKLVSGLVAEGKLEASKYEAIKNSYEAYYYNYSLYDSVGFKPFNQDKASEGTLGYEYKLSDYSEILTYLAVKEATEDGYEYNYFVDYSAIDVSVSFVEGSEDEDEEEDEDTSTENNTNVWLLASSILLVVAMAFAIASIFIRDMLKKKRRTKTFGKNNFDQNKANRYMRKLKIKQETIEEVEQSSEPEEAVEAPAEDDGEVTPDDGQE